MNSLNKPANRYHLCLIISLLLITATFLYRNVLFPGVQTDFFLFNLSRHTLERNLFLLITIYTGFVFGILPALMMLVASLVVMIPQAVFFSENMADAALEILLVTIAGLVVCYWIKLKENDDARYQKAVAILENTQEQLQTRIREARANSRRLATLNTISTALSQSLEPSKVIETSVEMIGEVMEVEVILVYVIDKQRAELILKAHDGISEDSAREFDHIELDKSLAGEVAKSGEALVIPDVFEYPGMLQPVIKRNKLRPLLIVPLKSKGEVIGTICVAMRRPRTFLPDEVDLLTTIAGQVASALTNANLYEESRQMADKLYNAARDYKNLFDNAHDAIWFHDMEGNIYASNRAINNLGDQDLSDTNANVKDFLNEKQLALSREVARKLLRGETFPQPYEQYSITKTGEVRTLMMTSILLVVDDKPVGFQHIARDVTEERKMQANLRYYLRQITNAQEDERKRIARELHDETSQALFAVSRQIDNFMRDNIGLSVPQKTFLQDIRLRIGQILQDIRRFSQDLRPSIIDDLGLIPAINWLIKQKSEESGITIELKVAGNEHRLLPDMELMLFRIIQEALNNIVKHSKAKSATVSVEFQESEVLLHIEDDGQGFELPKTVGDLSRTGKLGLVGMQERVTLLDGTMKIVSNLGKGTIIDVIIPQRI